MKLIKLAFSQHAFNRLKDRFGKLSFKSLITNPMVIYKDTFDMNKYIYNFDNGFMVLKRLGIDKYIVATIVLKKNSKVAIHNEKIVYDKVFLLNDRT